MLLQRHLSEEAVMHDMDTKEGEQIALDFKGEGALVKVTHLEVPAELAVIIQTLPGTIIPSYNKYFQFYYR